MLNIEQISLPSLGKLWVGKTIKGIKFAYWAKPFIKWQSTYKGKYTLVKESRSNSNIKNQLLEYIEGTQFNFSLPIDSSGWTNFQIAVREVILLIPYGTSMTYLEVSKTLGNKNLARAVGQVNATNPLSLIIPCHRLKGSNGSLCGYAGGLEMKSWLLEHERKQIELIYN